MALNIITQVLAPTVVFALTSGPTTPEVSSFEPVDTTDMVDLATGDFNYNIPLLEVPGPEGGYPVTLSYHAGIMPSQEASWIGLGWNLNPGCINRTVNNFADDYNNAKYTIADSWTGGETTEHSFGAGVTLAGLVSVGVDVGVKSDTYRGNGGSFGLSLGVSKGIGAGDANGDQSLSMGIGASVGYDSWDGQYGSANVGISGGEAGIGLNVGSYGGQSYASLGVNASFTQSSMGVSLSSGGLKGSATIAGVNSVSHNDNFGKMSTESYGLGLTLPVGAFYVSMGVKYSRYWMHGQSDTRLYGVLNSKNANNLSWTDKNGTVWPNCPYGSASLDCNILYDPNVNIANQGNLDWTTNPTVASYDNYTVMAQGLSGSMEPMMLDNGSFFTKIYNDPYDQIEMKTDILRQFTIEKHMFRFRNDFSNSHKVTPSNFTVSGSNMSYPIIGSAYTTDQMDSRGIRKDVDAYNRPTYEQISGSKKILHYTNEEITSGSAKTNGFINTLCIDPLERVNRTFSSGINTAYSSLVNYDVKKNIGGYSITNESGVTYHYALPVYTFDFYQNTVAANNVAYSISTRNVYNYNPYAYTWLLTAVTGPDYVDKDNDGVLSAGDWGYWVSFDYGRWTERYGFRTPEVGSNIDVDGSSTYSKGGKEIYYLNSISTRTHTALFIKEERGVEGRGYNGHDYNSYTKTLQNSNEYNIYKPVKALKLSEIILIENDKFQSVPQPYQWYDLKKCHSTVENQNSFDIGDCNSFYYQGQTYSYKAIVKWENVLDVADLDGRCSDLDPRYPSYQTPGNDIRNAAVKCIKFNHNNDLCSDNSAPAHTVGKLTLNSISFYGRNQIKLLPSTNFSYELDNPVSQNIQIGFGPGDIGFSDRSGRIDCGGANDFQEGDIIKCEVNYKTFYMTLTKAIPYYGASNSLYDVIFLGGNLPVAADKWKNTTASQTKNPAYVSSFYDIWGMFKSDYFPKPYVKRNKSRIGSELSAKSVDCWSLRSIETSTGAKINIKYEGDDYKDVVLKNKQIYNFKPEFCMKKASGSTYSPFQRSHYRTSWVAEPLDFIFEVSASDLQQPINEVFQIGDEIELITAGYYQSPPPNMSEGTKTKKAKVTVTGVNTNTITVRDNNNIILAAPTIPTPTNASYYYYYNLGAYVLAPDKKLNYGGGLRTKSIETTDGMVSSQTVYQYKDIANNSSGSTAFDPLCFNELERLSDITGPSLNIPLGASFHNQYSAEYYNAFANIMAIAKDVIAPGVLYGSVKVRNSVTKNGVTTDAPTYQAYQFQQFDTDMIEFFNLSTNPPNAIANARTTKITDKTSQIGNLLSIKTYDKSNRLLSEVKNTFTSDPETGQGIYEQVFHQGRRMNPDEGSNERKYASVTVKSEYPSVLMSTTKKDYAKGLSQTTSNTAFDFYTGAVTETQTTNSYGNTFISINDPAYNYYAGMGLKHNVLQNSNMLTQIAGSYSLKKTNTTSSVAVTVTSTGNSIAPNEVLVTLSGTNKLPMNYHIGSKIVGLSLPVFITYIADNRASFNAISRASSVSTDIGAKTLSIENANLLSASITTWSDKWNYRLFNGSGYVTQERIEDGATAQKEKVWRMKSSYMWNSVYSNPDGTYPASGPGAYVPFDYKAVNQTSPYWLAVSTNTLFTNYSKLLEQKDLNNKYTSVKFADNQRYIIASATNARYTEFTHSSAEFEESTYTEGEVSGSMYRTNENAHTGSFSFGIPPNQVIGYSMWNESESYQNNAPYRISVWVHKSVVGKAKLFYSCIASVPVYQTVTYDPTKHITCGNWVLMTMDITTPLTSSLISVGVLNIGTTGKIYVDDFRFQPFVSSVSANIYDIYTGLLTHVLGADNRYTRYEYDSRDRLKAIYKETTNGEVKLNEYNYNFARPIGY